MSKRPLNHPHHSVLPEPDHQMAELLENIEREETPERLLVLARQLQDRLIEKKRRGNPN